MRQYLLLFVIAVTGARVAQGIEVISMADANGTQGIEVISMADANGTQGIEVASGTGFEVVSEVVNGIQPERGDKLPPYVQTFAGCNCAWNEYTWSCDGSIAHPPEYQGGSCCCCGLKCQKSNRCSNEACLEIGVDQKAEVDAEEKRLAELLKGADMLIGDDLPAFVVDLGPGTCTDSKILAKCKEKGLTPMCDHTSYANGGRCYTPGWRNSGPEAKFYNRHFSHYSSHRQYFGLANDEMFYGMCFMTYGNGDWALTPLSSGHIWTSATTHSLTPWGGGNKNAPRNINPMVKQVNQCLKKEQGGVGCWRTLCVKKAPNRNGSPR